MVIGGTTLLSLCLALAVDPQGAETDVSGDTVPWIGRWVPERNQWELGIFGGVLFPHPRVELFQDDSTLPDRGFRALRGWSPELGARVGFFPLRILGIEAEAAVLPTETAEGASALLYAVRAHAIAQLPYWSVVPFAVAGASGLGVSSDRGAVGNDIDLGFHFGGGVRVFMTRHVAFRLDLRDVMTARRGVGRSVVHSAEILLGVSLTLGRSRPESAPAPAPIDGDGDGIFDPDDACIDTPGVSEYEGCPIPDMDGDGILDPDDACIDTPGVPEHEGCPIPDTDEDGIFDLDDACVDTPGVPEYEGCPIPDTDADGLLDPDDECPNDPETRNGFEDDDGCPDELPKELEKFTGVIVGIYFDTARASIRSTSTPVLDEAIEVLKRYPELRIQITGHTDDQGEELRDPRRRRGGADRIQ